jgi:Dolichyl-phosphate-mannose-protein mannosyltransferase
MVTTSAQAHPHQDTPARKFFWHSDSFILIVIALSTVVAHLLTANRYGFHRDELSILEDARHLAWGYVAYPPVTPFFGRIALLLFGTSLVGFRFFAALVQALAVLLTGLMARALGGGRNAQIAASLAAVPFCLGGGALMQYISFDYVAWVLTAYFVVRLLKSNNPRWLLAVGSSIGLGMLSKYTMLFFAVGVAAGIIFTDTRKYLRTIWPWLGPAVSISIFLPNFLWQLRHHFVTFDFLKFIHTRDVGLGLTQNFLPDQLELTLMALPIWTAGLYFLLFSRTGRRFRPLGWMYIVPLLLFLIAKGRGYYLAPAYPMLYAAGAVYGERWLTTLRPQLSAAIRAVLFTALSASIIGAAALSLPLAPINSAWWRAAVKVDSTFPDEIGWPEFAENLAHVRDALPADKRSRLGILAENYGEVGAINLYGPRFALPGAISGVNSSWERGYGSPEPETLIVVGFSPEFVQANFESCRLVAHSWNRYNIPNEETVERPDIFLCGPPRQGWPAFWESFQYFA